MRTIRLDVNCIHTAKALKIYLAYRLDAPAHYGRNLDALYDVLTDMDEETHIVLAGSAASAEMEAYLPRLEQVFEDAAQANGCLCFMREK